MNLIQKPLFKYLFVVLGTTFGLFAHPLIVSASAVDTGIVSRMPSKYEIAFLLNESISNNKEACVLPDLSQLGDDDLSILLSDAADIVQRMRGGLYHFSYIRSKASDSIIIHISRSAAELENNTVLSRSVAEIAKKAEGFKTTREKLAYINDMLVGLCNYDTEATPEMPSDTPWSAYGCIVLGEAVCGGYTNAVTLICEHLGIPVIEVYGARDGNLHTWNKVYVDGEWLNLDVTSNDPLLLGTGEASVSASNSRDYFLVTDEFLVAKGFTIFREDNIAALKYPELVHDKSFELWRAGIIDKPYKAVDHPITLRDLCSALSNVTNSSAVSEFASQDSAAILSREALCNIVLSVYGCSIPVEGDAIAYAISHGLLEAERDSMVRGGVAYYSDMVSLLFNCTSLNTPLESCKEEVF